MPDVEFLSSAGTATGYVALPVVGHGSATLVLHDWWGLDDHIRSVCDRFASEGFLALAPDLYRGERATEPSDAQQKTTSLSTEQAEQDMRGAVEFLASRPGVQGSGVGVVGFGLGGGLALSAAATCPQISAAVPYYYVMPDGKPDFAAIKCPVLGHFGTADVYISLKQAKAMEQDLRSAGINVEFEKYTAAGHAFFDETNRLGSYNEPAAQRSWTRTVSFLRTALAAPHR